MVSPSLDVSSDEISGNRIAISVLVDILEQVVPDCVGDLKIGLRSNLSGGSSHLLLPISHKEGSPQSSTEICLFSSYVIIRHLIVKIATKVMMI